MDEKSYESMAKIENTNWFFKGKRDLLSKIIKNYDLKIVNALDVGAGIGANIKFLEKFSKNVEGVEFSKKAIELAAKNNIKNIHHSDALKFKSKKTYDFILCSDIIEHVDDNKLLKNLKKLMKKDDKMFITIPAFNFLWGNSDVLAHHKKRYTMKNFKKIIEKNGYEIVFINYWNFLVFIPTTIYLYLFEKGIFRLLNKQPKDKLLGIPKWTNRVLYTIMKLENFLCKNIRLPFGVNIIALIKKK